MDSPEPTTPAQDRRLVIFFSAWIAVALLGSLVMIIIGRPDKVISGFIMAGVGVLMLLSYAVYRFGRARRERQERESTNAS